MKPVPLVLLAAAAMTVSVVAFATRNASRTVSPSLDPSRQIARGRYLVHQVGMCTDCHSPRNAQGEFIATRHLSGAPIAFAPTVAMPWTPAAPRIAGLPAGFTETDTIRFLMTGQRPNDRPAPLPSMPPYRFDRADAEAITAYLKSLTVPTPGE